MPYCTQQDLIDRFGSARLVQLTDKTNKPATTIDPVTVAKHIGDASSMIDGYVAKRHALPLVSVPAVLVKIGVDIAWYYLLGNAAGKDSPEAIAYRDAISWLESVSKGLVVLDDGGTAPLPSGGGQIQTSAPDRVFTRDSMAGF